jgi:hypothetical protein
MKPLGDNEVGHNTALILLPKGFRRMRETEKELGKSNPAKEEQYRVSECDTLEPKPYKWVMRVGPNGLETNPEAEPEQLASIKTIVLRFRQEQLQRLQSP